MKFHSSISGMQGLQGALKQVANDYSKGNTHVLVGFPEPEQHGGSDETIAGIAAQHEFGAGDIPERPFLRNGVAAAVPQIKDAMAEGLANIATGKINSDQLLDVVGVTAVASVQQMIDEIKTPPNSPATIAQKGSANPLIDTGEMRQSVTYVKSNKPQEGI